MEFLGQFGKQASVVDVKIFGGRAVTRSDMQDVWEMWTIGGLETIDRTCASSRKDHAVQMQEGQTSGLQRQSWRNEDVGAVGYVRLR